MASQDESLVLAARVVDAFSPTLKDLQRSLRAISAETKISHKVGVDSAKSHSAALTELGQTFRVTAERARTTFVPALAAIGIAGFGAAEGLRKIVEAITEFADSSRSLDHQRLVWIRRAFLRFRQFRPKPAPVSPMSAFGAFSAGEPRGYSAGFVSGAGGCLQRLQQVGPRGYSGR